MQKLHARAKPATESSEDVPPPRPSSHRGALILVGLCVVVANLPYLIGWFDPNPLLQVSGLGQGVTPGILPGTSTIDPNSGFTSQALAHRAALDWIHGQVPWWNPFEGLGAPLAGEMQAAAFFPLIVLLLVPDGQMFLYLILDLAAAYGTYFLLRRLGLGPWACVAGGVAFGLNGTFSWFRFAPSNPVCFLPLALLAVEVIRQRTVDGRRTRWWLLSLPIALSLVAGFPEVAFLDALVVVIWILFRLPGLSRPLIGRYLGSSTIGGLVGVLVAAPVLVAFADYLPVADTSGHASGYVHSFLPHSGLGSLVFPYLFGPIFGFSGPTGGGPELSDLWGNAGGYLTVALALLAAVGLLGRAHRPLKVALAVWSALLVTRTYGVVDASVVFNLIPGMKDVASYRYMDPSLELSVTVLAAFGVHDLLQRGVGRVRLAVTTVIVAVAAVVAAERGDELARTLTGSHHLAWEQASLAWGLATTLIIAVVGLLRRRTGVFALVLAGLLPLEAMAMFVVPETSAPRAGHVDAALVSYLRHHIGLSRFATLGPFAPNYGSYYGLASINVNDTPAPQRFNTVVTHDLDPNSLGILFTGGYSVDATGLTPDAAFTRYLADYEALGVHYLIAPAGQAVAGPGGHPLTEVYRDALATVWETPTVDPYFSDPTPGCTVRSSGRQHAVIHCSKPSTLQRSELYMPGWSVTVDGAHRRITPTRLSLQAVRLPAGTSVVSYRFTPPHIALGWAAAILGVLACLWSARPDRPLTRRRRHPVNRAPAT